MLDPVSRGNMNMADVWEDWAFKPGQYVEWDMVFCYSSLKINEFHLKTWESRDTGVA